MVTALLETIGLEEPPKQPQFMLGGPPPYGLQWIKT